MRKSPQTQTEQQAGPVGMVQYFNRPDRHVEDVYAGDSYLGFLPTSPEQTDPDPENPEPLVLLVAYRGVVRYLTIPQAAHNSMRAEGEESIPAEELSPDDYPHGFHFVSLAGEGPEYEPATYHFIEQDSSAKHPASS